MSAAVYDPESEYMECSRDVEAFSEQNYSEMLPEQSTPFGNKRMSNQSVKITRGTRDMKARVLKTPKTKSHKYARNSSEKKITPITEIS